MNGCLTALVVLFLLPFAAVIIFIIKLIFKGKNDAWKGTVVDKKHMEQDADDSGKIEHLYSLKIKMENGKERNIAVSGEFWDSTRVGDVIEKPKGSLYPKKARKG